MDDERWADLDGRFANRQVPSPTRAGVAGRGHVLQSVQLTQEAAVLRYATQFLVLGALLTPVSVLSADIGTDAAQRFGSHAFRLDAAAPRFTLMEPGDALLPLIEPLQAVDTLPHTANNPQRLLDTGFPLQPSPGDAPRSSRPLSYSLSERVTAQFGYRHSLLFDTAPAAALRSDLLSGFSTERERDVVDLNMSWRLAGNTLGLGYQFQAARPNPDLGAQGLAGVIPGEEHTLHSLTLGVRREWGAPNPAMLVENRPSFDPEPAPVEVSEPTPTP